MASTICWKLVLSFLILTVGGFLVATCFENKPFFEKWNQTIETVSEISLITGFIVMIFAVWFTNMS